MMDNSECRCLVMFNYTIQKSTGNLIVTLPNRLDFGTRFMVEMNRLIYKVTKLPNITRVTVKCSENIEYDGMSQSYLINVLSHLNQMPNKSIYINSHFKSLIREKVRQKQGDKYEKEFDIGKLAQSKELEYYVFEGKENTDKPIEHIAGLLTVYSLAVNRNALNNFLYTTIGEIFSNSNNHSEREEVFFSCMVKNVENDVFLYVSIIDYGTTILTNVRNYHKEFKEEDKFMPGDMCIYWAVQPCNTTRAGSGGHGLPMLIDYIKAAKADLMICSGESFCMIKDGETERYENLDSGVFCGTSIAFRVKLNDPNLLLYFNKDSNKIDSINLSDII